jgi:predicted TIM-barrel fold metal-dependent hydrolase
VPDAVPVARRIAGGCDAHVHLYGPLAQYPVHGSAQYQVPDATPEQLIAQMDAAGVAHAVVVHPAVSGRDNRRTLDALRAYPDRFRGVLTPPLAPPDDRQLSDWHLLGVRGIRFSYTRTAQAGMAIDPAMTGRLADMGWHAQVHLEPEHLLELEGMLASLPCTVVIDHMARIPAAAGPSSPAMSALCRLLDRGHVWVKLSAPMRLSSQDEAPYEDVVPMARLLVERAPHRLVWGSDWPNVNLPSAAPAYPVLLDLLGRWAPDALRHRQILIDNPSALYDLPASTVPPSQSRLSATPEAPDHTH